VRLIELLDDPVRSVRIEIARSLLDAPVARLPKRYSEWFSTAMSEYKASLKATADFPETQMALAGVALTTRQFEAANAAFREATEMDPQLEQAWIMQARIQAAFGRSQEAISILEKASKANPSSIAIYQTLNEARKGEKN
jgi:predicted Zn-dependent protease